MKNILRLIASLMFLLTVNAFAGGTFYTYDFSLASGSNISFEPGAPGAGGTGSFEGITCAPNGAQEVRCSAPSFGGMSPSSSINFNVLAPDNTVAGVLTLTADGSGAGSYNFAANGSSNSAYTCASVSGNASAPSTPYAFTAQNAITCSVATESPTENINLSGELDLSVGAAAITGSPSWVSSPSIAPFSGSYYQLSFVTDSATYPTAVGDFLITVPVSAGADTQNIYLDLNYKTGSYTLNLIKPTSSFTLQSSSNIYTCTPTIDGTGALNLGCSEASVTTSKNQSLSITAFSGLTLGSASINGTPPLWATGVTASGTNGSYSLNFSANTVNYPSDNGTFVVAVPVSASSSSSATLLMDVDVTNGALSTVMDTASPTVLTLQDNSNNTYTCRPTMANASVNLNCSTTPTNTIEDYGIKVTGGSVTGFPSLILGKASVLSSPTSWNPAPEASTQGSSGAYNFSFTANTTAYQNESGEFVISIPVNTADASNSTNILVDVNAANGVLSSALDSSSPTSFTMSDNKNNTYTCGVSLSASTGTAGTVNLSCTAAPTTVSPTYGINVTGASSGLILGTSTVNSAAANWATNSVMQGTKGTYSLSFTANAARYSAAATTGTFVVSIPVSVSGNSAPVDILVDVNAAGGVLSSTLDQNSPTSLTLSDNNNHTYSCGIALPASGSTATGGTITLTCAAPTPTTVSPTYNFSINAVNGLTLGRASLNPGYPSWATGAAAAGTSGAYAIGFSANNATYSGSTGTFVVAVPVSASSSSSATLLVDVKATNGSLSSILDPASPTSFTLTDANHNTYTCVPAMSGGTISLGCSSVLVQPYAVSFNNNLTGVSGQQWVNITGFSSTFAGPSYTGFTASGNVSSSSPLSVGGQSSASIGNLNLLNNNSVTGRVIINAIWSTGSRPVSGSPVNGIPITLTWTLASGQAPGTVTVAINSARARANLKPEVRPAASVNCSSGACIITLSTLSSAQKKVK